MFVLQAASLTNMEFVLNAQFQTVQTVILPLQQLVIDAMLQLNWLMMLLGVHARMVNHSSLREDVLLVP